MRDDAEATRNMCMIETCDVCGSNSDIGRDAIGPLKEGVPRMQVMGPAHSLGWSPQKWPGVP